MSELGTKLGTNLEYLGTNLELKPCPFCAELSCVDVFDESRDGCNNFVVVCSVNETSPIPSADWRAGCGATGGFGRTREEAISKWNRRV